LFERSIGVDFNPFDRFGKTPRSDKVRLNTLFCGGVNNDDDPRGVHLLGA
jgi:hypothetical protein